MDLQVYAAVQNPWSLSPRRISHMHGLMMASVRRRQALEANSTRLATAVGFNGDEKGVFEDYINNLMARTVLTSRDAADDNQSINIENDEEAEAAILAMAEAIREKGAQTT